MTCNGRTGRSRCDGRILDADGERTAAYRLDYPLHSKSLGVGICDLARPAATSSYSRRGSHNPPVVGSSPTRPTCDLIQRPGQTVNLGRERAAQIEFGKLLAMAQARAAARLGNHRGPTARPVRVNRPVGRVHPGKQPRLYPPDHQACYRVHTGPQGPRPTAGHRVSRFGGVARKAAASVSSDHGRLGPAVLMRAAQARCRAMRRPA